MLSKLSNVLPLRSLAAAALALVPASAAFAQTAPAKPEEKPSFSIGSTIYTSYTYTDAPTTKDADGNTIHPSSFEVSRAYINVTGKLLNHLSWRITPDIAGRFSTSATSAVVGGTPGETVTTKAGTSYDGNLVFRLKYAYGQFDLDPWLPKGSWIRFGQSQTPYLDFIEGIYRYRFQGTTYAERQGYITSSDPGISFHVNIPNDYGDIQFGYFNGDGYSKAETNDQKSFQVRGTVRPFAKADVVKGIRLTAFYDADHYVKSAPRDRFIGSATFEHKYINVGADYLNVKDQTSATAAEVQGNGYSFWVNPKSDVGLEGMIRYDNTKPNKSVDAHQKRLIAGVSYWFKLQKPGSAAIYANYEKVDYDSALNKPQEKRFAISCLFAF